MKHYRRFLVAVNAVFFVEENLWLQRKRYVFGKSALDISSLIIRAMKRKSICLFTWAAWPSVAQSAINGSCDARMPCKFEEILTAKFLFVLKDWRKILATLWRRKSLLILAIPVRVFRLSLVRSAMLHDKPVATSVVANPGICLSPIPEKQH